jgi:hypothetical protein
VTRQRSGDGPDQRGVEGDDSAIWRSLANLSVWPCGRSARTPRSLPSPPGGAISPYGRMGHGVQRRQRGDGQAAGPTAVRWPAAARSAAGQIGKPTSSASLLLLPAWRPGSGRPALMCGTSYGMSCASVALPTTRLAHSRTCLIVFAALPAARHANHYAGEADPRALRGMSMTSCSSWLPGRMVIRTLPPPPPHHVCRPTAPARRPCCQTHLARPRP